MTTFVKLGLVLSWSRCFPFFPFSFFFICQFPSCSWSIVESWNCCCSTAFLGSKSFQTKSNLWLSFHAPIWHPVLKMTVECVHISSRLTPNKSLESIASNSVCGYLCICVSVCLHACVRVCACMRTCACVACSHTSEFKAWTGVDLLKRFRPICDFQR